MIDSVHERAAQARPWLNRTCARPRSWAGDDVSMTLRVAPVSVAGARL